MSVDRIPLPRTDGSLWLCGRKDVGPSADAVLRFAEATTIVCLNPVDELEARYPEYVDWLRQNMAGAAIWFPIDNFSAPSARTVLPIVERIVDRLEAGEGVVMHCAAGQGRAGTMAACVLIALGAEPNDAVRTVASHRVFAGPGNSTQWALVEGIADMLR